MIIRPLITLALLVILLLAMLQAHTGRLVPASMATVIGFGILLTWSPTPSTEIAHFLGVGRGTDLLVYIWILISLFMFFIVYVKFLQTSEQLTELARSLSLLQAAQSKTSRETESKE
jgi:hypothetical protein